MMCDLLCVKALRLEGQTSFAKYWRAWRAQDEGSSGSSYILHQAGDRRVLTHVLCIEKALLALVDDTNEISYHSRSKDANILP